MLLSLEVHRTICDDDKFGSLEVYILCVMLISLEVYRIICDEDETQTTNMLLWALCQILQEIKLFWQILRAFQISKRSKGLRSHKLSRTEVHLFPTVVYLLVFAKLGDETSRSKESCSLVQGDLLARRWITCSLKWPTVPSNHRQIWRTLADRGNSKRRPNQPKDRPTR